MMPRAVGLFRVVLHRPRERDGMRSRQHRQRGQTLRVAVGDDPRQAAAPVVADEMESAASTSDRRGDVERIADQLLDAVIVEDRRIGRASAA